MDIVSRTEIITVIFNNIIRKILATIKHTTMDDN
jgi:hypothetical protein